MTSRFQLNHMTSAAAHWKSVYKLSIAIVIVVSTIIVLINQRHDLHSGLMALQAADLSSCGLALAAIYAGYIMAALSYSALSLEKTVFGQTLIVQIASGFVNRLLPAGFGSIGLFTVYLQRRGYTLTEASAIIATNNLLGIVGSLLLIAGLLIMQPSYGRQLHVPTVRPSIHIVTLVLIIIVGLLLFVASNHTKKIWQYISPTWQFLRSRLYPNWFSALALICNMALTCLLSQAFNLSLAAVGVHIGWPVGLLVLSAGTVIGAVIPTPGGIGGVEAGLVAGLLSFNIPAVSGLAGVLVFRILSYWLPIIPGLIAFYICQKRYV